MSTTKGRRSVDKRRRDTRLRGRRIVLWALALSGLAQLLGGLVLDYVWIRARFPGQADLYAKLRACERTPEIIFLGSSRFGGDINCAVLDAFLRRDLGDQAPRTFNAALPYGDPTLCERVFDDILRQGHRPKLVVVEVCPENLAWRDNWLNEHARRLLDWRDVPEAALALCRNGKIMSLVNGRLLPLCTHRYQICKEAVGLMTSLFDAEPSGASGPASQPASLVLVQTDPEPPALTPARRAVLEKGYDLVSREVKEYRVGGMAARRLERLLDRCQSAGMAVVLVGAPVSSVFRRACTPDVDAAFLAYMHSLIERYGCFYSDWRDRVPDKYFCDFHHVLPQGGVYFSRRLAPSLLVPAWRHLLHDGSLSKLVVERQG